MDTNQLKPASLYEALKAQADAHPERIALVFRDQKLSFRGLLDLVDQLAQKIPSFQNIGVVMDHTPLLIALLFAINKQGSAFVPVEPDFPLRRIENMFDQAEVQYVVADSSLSESLGKYTLIDPAQSQDLSGNEQEELRADENAIAYILFTSGTTGNPKGVVVKNRNVLNYIQAFDEEFHLKPEDRMLQNSVVSFDIFIEEVFASLLNGASLAIAAPEEKSGAEALQDFINEHQVTIVDGFPYLLEEFNEAHILPESLRLMISGGDTLRLQHIDWLVGQVEIYNTYGPSETTVCAAYYPASKEAVLEDGTFPIGHPVKNVSIEIHRPDGSLCDPFEPGEIWIGGAGVSAGYIKPVEESRNFQEVDGKRIYHSGDRGYVDEKGTLYFLGREDRQIMIDGRRVELSELENRIYQLEGIDQVFIHHRMNERNRVEMIAFYSGKPEADEMRDYLKSYFPGYMVPSKIIHVDKLILNDHGKADAARMMELYVKD